jgi:hypothetical protein
VTETDCSIRAPWLRLPLSLGLFAAGHFVQLTVEVDREELSLLFIVALIREFDKLWLLSVVFV